MSTQPLLSKGSCSQELALRQKRSQPHSKIKAQGFSELETLFTWLGLNSKVQQVRAACQALQSVLL